MISDLECCKIRRNVLFFRKTTEEIESYPHRYSYPQKIKLSAGKKLSARIFQKKLTIEKN